MGLFWLALRARPKCAVQALFAWARGRRVRARRLVREAAAGHPDYYAWWHKRVGPELIARWCDEHPVRSNLSHKIAVLILEGPGHDRAASQRGLSRALPRAILVEPKPDLTTSLRLAQDLGAEWLIVLSAADYLTPGFDAVMDRLPDDIGTDVVFWDHDLQGPGLVPVPVIKPDWDPLLAQSENLLGSAAMVRLSTLVGATQERTVDCLSRGEVECLQTELATGTVPHHVPLILSHIAAGRGRSSKSEQCPRPQPAIPKRSAPGVTVVIPTRDQVDVLRACIAGLDRLNYPGPIETIVIDNGSRDSAALEFLDLLAGRSSYRVERWPGAFNFSAMMNHAAELASQPYLCLLNNDIEPLDGAWLAEMMAKACHPQAGAVGARLLYPDGTVQHVGVAIGVGGAAGHVEKGVRPGDRRFSLWHDATRRVSAVTAACLLVEKAKFVAVGGMDAEAFAVDFNDVDFCLRLDRAGWNNMVVVEATLLHHESQTRGTRRQGDDLRRFETELANLRLRWGTESYQDPWHSPLLAKESERCTLRN